MLLAGALTLATYGVWLALDGGSSTPEDTANETRPILIPALVAGLGMGLALLAKGPVGAIFPLLIGFVALVFTRRLRVLASARVWIALAVALAVALLMAWPWVVAISARIPGFLSDFILKENVARYSGGVEFHKPSPPWFYIPVLLVGLLPWSAFLLAAAPARNAREARALWFWGVWAFVIVGVFSLSSTKLVSYVLPAFAPMSLLLGFFFAARIQGEEQDQEPAQVLEATPVSKKRRSRGEELPARAQQKSQKRWRLALWISLILQAVLVAGASFFLLSDKILPRAEGVPIVAGAAVAQAVSVVGIIAALSKSLSILGSKRPPAPENFNRGGETLRVFGWTWAGSLLLHLVLLFGASRVALYEDSGSPMRALSAYMRPQDRVVSLQEFQPSAIFYAARPVFLVDFSNTSGLDDASIKASKYFPAYKPGMLERWRKDKTRIFLLVRDKTPFLGELSKKWTRVAITNDHQIFCNHDAPKGFRYDFVAPRKRER
jgi:4-amino-4-deoxy-L-arabinose transferase-like glycosyltransferase